MRLVWIDPSKYKHAFPSSVVSPSPVASLGVVGTPWVLLLCALPVVMSMVGVAMVLLQDLCDEEEPVSPRPRIIRRSSGCALGLEQVPLGDKWYLSEPEDFAASEDAVAVTTPIPTTPSLQTFPESSSQISVAGALVDYFDDVPASGEECGVR